MCGNIKIKPKKKVWKKMKDLDCGGKLGEEAALNEESGLQQKKRGVWVAET